MSIGIVNQSNGQTRHIAQLVCLVALLSAATLGCDNPSRGSSVDPTSVAGTSGARGTAGRDNGNRNQAGNSGAGGTRATNAGATATVGSGGALGEAVTSTAGSSDANQTSAGNGGAGGQGGKAPVKACVQKAAGEWACDKATLYKCDGNGHSDSSEVCKTGAKGETAENLCKAGMAKGKCAVCAPGKYQCAAATLQKCDDSGLWKAAQTCKPEETCSAENQSCGKCKAGAFKCGDDGALSQCDEKQNGFESTGKNCGSREMCDDKKGQCYDCKPNSTDCDKEGTKVITCSADGKITAQTPCTGNTKICQDGKCVQCKENEDCKSDNVCAPETCNNGTCVATNVPYSLLGKTQCDKGVCNGLGACVACIDSSDCATNKECTLGFGGMSCTARNALTVAASLGGLVAGSYTGTLNAGYKLTVDAKYASGCSGQVTISDSGSFFGNSCNFSSTYNDVCFGISGESTNFNISGPTGKVCQPTNTSAYAATIGFCSSSNTSCNCDCPAVTLTASDK